MITDNTDNYKSQLELKQLQLHWLLQITKAINYNIPSANLFEIFKTVLRDHLKVEKLTLIVNRNGWCIPAKYGESNELPADDLAHLAKEIFNYSNGTGEKSSWLNQYDTIVPVFHKDSPLAYALLGNISLEKPELKRELITFIHTITNIIVVAIENKRLGKESIQQAAVQRELELAAEMQAMLFPTNLVSHEYLDIAATYIPHQQIGGDYYDFIALNENEALVCMADVSGKGISAALLMSNFQANLHALVRHGVSLKDMIFDLNDRVNYTAKGEKFITFFVARINFKTYEIHYVNAGHNPPILMSSTSTEVLENGTTGLGMFDELPFLNEGRIEFPDDAVLFCYTDGITEMENMQGVAFGLENLSGLLSLHQGVENMKSLHELMVNAFNEFRQDNEFTDDVTFLSLRLNRKFKTI